MISKPKRLAFLSMMTAFALVLSYIEALLPPIYSAVPGVKIGLPNIVIRMFLVALLFGNAMTLLYSVAGAVLSIAVMWVLKRTKLFSKLGVSVAGGVFHNVGQIIVAVIVLQTVEIGLYMPILAISGTLAGIAVGLISSLLIKKLEKIKLW